MIISGVVISKKFFGLQIEIHEILNSEGKPINKNHFYKLQELKIMVRQVKILLFIDFLKYHLIPLYF